VRLREDELVTREVGGKVMILDLASSTYFAVGGAGVAILDALRDGDVTEDDVVARLLTRFDVDRHTLEADVTAFLDRLGQAGLLIR
jgi:hypothetical protein